MDKSVKHTLLKSATGETNTEILDAFLEVSKDKILSRMYPFGRADDVALPTVYDSLQVEIAAYLLNKRGAEGQTSHNENGISRTYESASVPDSMLKDIIPNGVVIGGSNENP